MLLAKDMPQFMVEAERKRAKEANPSLTEEELLKKYPDTHVTLEEFEKKYPSKINGQIVMY